MTKKCVQCNKNFTISDSEIKFYEEKNLTLPKRCKECRERNKNSFSTDKNKKYPQEYQSYYVKKNSNSILVSFIIATILAFGAFLFTGETILVIIASLFAVTSLIVYILTFRKNNVFIEEFDTSIYKYTFYDTNSMVKHYVKHSEQTNCSSMEDYLFKANMVITDKGSLSKIQKKDGDRVYYNKRTNEIVVIAKAGYVRTYFIASDKYYNKQ